MSRSVSALPQFCWAVRAESAAWTPLKTARCWGFETSPYQAPSTPVTRSISGVRRLIRPQSGGSSKRLTLSGWGRRSREPATTIRSPLSCLHVTGSSNVEGRSRSRASAHPQRLSPKLPEGGWESRRETTLRIRSLSCRSPEPAAGEGSHRSGERAADPPISTVCQPASLQERRHAASGSPTAVPWREERLPAKSRGKTDDGSRAGRQTQPRERPGSTVGGGSACSPITPARWPFLSHVFAPFPTAQVVGGSRRRAHRSAPRA